MIIVWGSVQTRTEHRDKVLLLSQSHVNRSRTETGCLAHGAYIDSEDSNRIVFFEKWADRAALDAHFTVPASNEFVQQLSPLLIAPPTIELFEARPSN